jgi:uncharacterized protein (DUF885 family)
VKLLAPVALVACAACAPAAAPAPPPGAAPPIPQSAAAPTSAEPALPDTSDDAAIARAGQDYVDWLAAAMPEEATGLGVHTHDADLDAYDLATADANVAREEAMLADLRARFAAPRASRGAKIDLALLESTLDLAVRVWRATEPLKHRPDAYTSPMNALFLMTAREYAPADERARNVLARIERLPAVVALGRVNLVVKAGPPRPWVQIGIDQAKSAAAFFDEQRAFLARALPADKARIDAAVGAAKKAYADYAAFLARDVMPHATGDFAAGRELFDLMLRDGYFLDENADDVYALGKRVFDRTQAAMEELARRIDPQAHGWPEVTRKIKGHHPTADGLLASYRTEVARARKFLADKDVVAFPPGDDCAVVDTPAFLRSTVSAAYDAPPPLDSVTRGFFFVTPVEPTLSPRQREEMLRENDYGDVVDTVVHETYPGHHLQLSFARRHPSLIRKVAGTSVFAEGWALYSEELMNELGYYDDEQRMMQLEWTLVRAARVLIDVSLHTRGMTFDEAVKVLTDQVHLEHALAVSEVKRYTITPTQPLSYIVGRERILAIRERYKQRAGAAYSLKAFHSEILGHGTIPPGLVEREMFD